jgi:2-polyprenyl-6-methoxyphenol hydroxylase-like FAD-dependent oxidoreductase
MGYAPIFLERRMLIQALYDNLNDKSKVHIGTGVSSVNLTSDGVQATARNGDQYFGQILIGADGIHSTVRSEMWRLADEQQPSLFVLGEQKSALVTYCCMFGISNPKDGFPKFQTQHIQGKNHSYLLSTGPGNDVYWFLFERLAVPAYGLHDKIPRYTDAEKDALAEEHVGDQLSDALTFGNLYQARRAATLQALPEVVFSRWHYGRIMTIGDAAHKVSHATCLSASCGY